MKQGKTSGVTLIEILLVLVIVGIVMFAAMQYMQQRALQMRIDRTTMQMQQILNAGMSYYVQNGKWPASLATLTGSYLPSTPNSPFNTAYLVGTNNNNQNFYVYTRLSTPTSKLAGAVANIVAGTLPLGYTSTAAGNPPPTNKPCAVATNLCYVVAQVNLPGQNLNNASAVNFAKLYHNAACVPVPVCPVDSTGSTMTPEIIVAPVQVNGAADSASNQSGNPNLYPISGFTAYATPPSAPNANPQACNNSVVTTCPGAVASPSGYWRVCMQVVTEQGELKDPASQQWSDYQTMMVITRCAIKNEPRGSAFNYMSD